jgi:hypothetical protein
MNFLYFAYGSNMLPARLLKRCPSARVIGGATAIGFRIEFSKESKDKSGKATLFESADSDTLGVIFEVEEADRSKLDSAEGAGSGYERSDDFLVRVEESGECVITTTYLASRIDTKLKPYDWYLALVIAGAIHHDLNVDHLARLRGFEYLIDERLDRAGRLDALEALRDHGFHDHRALLRPTS